MAQPFDYSIDVQAPFAAALQGFQGGAAMRQMIDARAAAEQQRAAQEQMSRDLGAVASNPNATGADYARIMTQYPQLSEHLKRGWDTLNESQRQSKVQQGSQAYAAILSGRSDIAEQLFRDRAAAARNSGAEPQAREAETMAELIRSHPDTARTTLAMSLSSYMGADKFASTFETLEKERRARQGEPAALRKGEADATKAEADATTAQVTAANAPAMQAAELGEKQANAATAGVKAKFAESNALIDLEAKGWNIKAIKEDIEIKKQANRIAAMNAATAREGNSLKAQELRLKISEAQGKLDEKVREKVAAAESGATSIDNMLNTIERIKRNPRLNDVVGTFEGRLPAIADDESADAVALIETLGSQAFVAQIPNIKGTGALSDAEGKKLQSALTNLSRVQSETQFRANLDEAARLLTKGRENLSRATGVPLGKPDTPSRPGARPPLESFNR